MIFGADQAVQILANSVEWYCDGTFGVCPQIFFHLYTIHARINSKTIPCIFGLLPSKTRITYDRFFLEIRNHVLAAGNEPNTILCDFELAAINSASATFPNADLSGCFFHLCSNIWKKIQSLGLQVQYNNDQEFALHLRMIPALAFIPPNDVVDAFERLTDLIRNQYGDATDGVLDYFEDTYIGRFRRNAARATPNFPIQMWNMFHRTHEELPRTNNHIEGWHRKFQSICMCYHPTFWKFINLLKKEQTLNRVDMVQAEAGHPPPAQRRRYVDCNQRIIAIVDDYPNRDNMRYLRGIAHNLGF